MYSSKECACDPLKRILQKFLLTVTTKCVDDNNDKKCGYDAELVSKLHLFYKPSSLRFPTDRRAPGGTSPENRLVCRVSDEIIKNLKEWWELGSKIETNKNIFNLEKLKGLICGDDSSLVRNLEYDRFGNYTLELNLNLMKGAVIKWMATQGWKDYSRVVCHNHMYRAEILMARQASSMGSEEKDSDSSPTPLLEYRKNLVAQGISAILRKVGHFVDEANFTCVSVPSNNDSKKFLNTIFVAGFLDINNSEITRVIPETDPETVLRVDLGSVFANSCGNLQDMLSKRLAEIKEISESRRLESLVLSSWATSLDNLTRATLNYDLLYRPLETDIHLVSLSDSGQMNHDALLIMYNYSRILSILRKFAEQVEKEEYPQLPNVNDINFTQLCEREEERQLLQLVMEWPRVMEVSVNFVRCQLSLFIIPKYLLALAKAFNNFYFQIVVLVPTNASHNFATMMARVWLIRSICAVFEDVLDILQVSHGNSV